MISQESGNGTGAGGRMHFDLRAAETEYRPTLSGGFSIKGCIVGQVSRVSSVMPVTAIGLNEQSCVPEHEVWLPSLPHGLVHSKPQPSFLEFTAKNFLDVGKRKVLAQSGLAYLFSYLDRMLMAKSVFVSKAFQAPFVNYLRLQCDFTQLLDGFKRMLLAKPSLAQLLAGFDRVFPPTISFANLLPRFKRMLLAKTGEAHSPPRLCRMMCSCFHMSIITHGASPLTFTTR